jgi:uncharacterized delta-60 repeat protein
MAQATVMRGLLLRCVVAVTACALALPAAAAAAGTPGSLDPSFDFVGVAALGSGTQLFGVAVENDGEIIAVGQSGGSVLVQCLSANGAPAGQFSGGPGVARAVAIQPDGKAVVAGSSGGMFVQRFNADCTPDASFDNGSAAVAPLSGGSANALAIAPDGTIVVAGSVPYADVSGSSTRPALAAFNASGGLDTSFGLGGVEVIDHGHPYAVATAVAVQSDGKIVLAGRWQDPHYAVTSGWIERLSAVGADDSSFAGGSGVYSYSSQGAGYASLNALALQGDGRIVAAGTDLAGTSAAFVRLNADGTPDTSFGSGGASLLSSGTFSGTPYGANGVGIAGGGRIVGAGAIYLYGAHNVGLWALTPGGLPDAEGAFSSSGTVTEQLVAEACGMAVAPDGSLVVVGDSVGLGRPYNVDPCTPSSTSTAFVARDIGFGPPPVGSTPTVTTGAAGSITQSSALVTGQVNPNGLSTSYHFDYGPTAAYGSSTGTATLAAANAPTTVSQALTGLAPATAYHYRLVASNADGTTIGSDATFTTTPATAPSVSTGTASQIGEVSATVSGSVNPNGLATSYHVVYGETAGYGSSTKPATLAAALAPTIVSVALTSLRPATTYHYRLVATNADGTSSGLDGTFKTSARVSVRLSGVRRSYRIASIEKSGLALTVNCSQPCSIRGSLVIPSKTVKRLRLGSRELTLGSGSASLSRAGSGRLRLHLTRTGARLLAGFKKLGVTLRIAIHPTGGGPTVTVSESLALDR